MSPGPRREPEAEPGLEELAATDALLDRLGRRDPADPLDRVDPVADLLSLFTAHLDDEPVPVGRTVEALARAETARPGASGSVPGAPVPGAALSGVPALRPVPAHPDATAGPGDPFADPDDDLERPAAGYHRALRSLPVPVADDDPTAPSTAARRGLRGRRDRPDVLPLPSDRPQRRTEGVRTVRFNPLAGAAAVLVLVLAASALSGFLTGGTSFNPLNGVELVVQRLTGTQPVQKVTRGQVEARLAEARGALADGDLERARREVGQARGLAAALAPNDRDAVRPQIVRLEQQIETAQARRTRGTLEGAPAPGPVPPDGPYPPVVPSVASAAD